MKQTIFFVSNNTFFFHNYLKEEFFFGFADLTTLTCRGLKKLVGAWVFVYDRVWRLVLDLEKRWINLEVFAFQRNERGVRWHLSVQQTLGIRVDPKPCKRLTINPRNVASLSTKFFSFFFTNLWNFCLAFSAVTGVIKSKNIL